MDQDDLRQILLSLLKEAAEPAGEKLRPRSVEDGSGEAALRTGDSRVLASEPVMRVILSSDGPGSESTGQRNSGEERFAGAWIPHLAEVMQRQAEQVEENTKALRESTLDRAAGVAAAVRTVAGGGAPGLSLLSSPLVSLASGLAKLFGGRSESGPAPLAHYWRPPELNLEVGLTGQPRMVAAADHDLEGRPRPIVAAGTPQVTVNVQAMDSRSFVEHSDDIARAIREAILNSHSLNELLTDL